MIPTAESANALVVECTRETESVRDAQRLRDEVFAEELGARRTPAAGRLDLDRFDDHCAHLLVREGRGGPAVACARLLTAADAMAAGGFESQRQFDMTRALTMPGRLLEVGRVCVARRRRDGAALSALWNGLAREARARGADSLIGRASVPFDPETETLAPLSESLRERWTSDAYRVYPRRPVPRGPRGESRRAALPPLLAAYLRLGAEVGGEPSWDPEFGTADFFVLLPVDGLARRWAPSYLRSGERALETP
ncbi:MAG: GNAT family N-acetyltransferase [Elusimicrobia bacterium]|nr:GNAT family N-acetyltransferase [Elusimicrobiota bacterium]